MGLMVQVFYGAIFTALIWFVLLLVVRALGGGFHAVIYAGVVAGVLGFFSAYTLYWVRTQKRARFRR